MPLERLLAVEDRSILADGIVPFSSQRRPGPDEVQWKIPRAEWPVVLHQVEQGESLREVGRSYGVYRMKQ